MMSTLIEHHLHFVKRTMSQKRLAAFFGVALFLFLTSHCTAQEDFRTWTSSSGTYEIVGKYLKIDGKNVIIETRDGKTKTVAIRKLSAADIQFLKGKVPSKTPKTIKKKPSPSRPIIKQISGNKGGLNIKKLEGREKRSAGAREAIAMYQAAIDENNIHPEAIQFVQKRIAELTPLVATGHLNLDGEYYDPEEQKQMLLDTEALIQLLLFSDEELNEKQVLKKIKQAKKDDKISLQLPILLGLNFVFQNDLEQAQKQFEDAVERVEKYRRYPDVSDAHNRVCALNNLAVCLARLGELSRAAKYWILAVEYDTDVNGTIAHNIYKVKRMVSTAPKSGLDNRNKKTGEKLLSLHKQLPSTTKGGWKLMFPIKIDKTPYDLAKLAKPSPKFAVFANYMEDYRCVGCAGSAKIKCLENRCKNGQRSYKIPGEPIYLDGQQIGVGKQRTVKETCGRCNGSGVNRCPHCKRGCQEKPGS